jgi:hypothetical protein
MGDPKDHVVAVRPAKGGTCYLCGAPLDIAPGIQIQVQMPIMKFKKIIQKGCVPCAKELRSLLDLRIQQAERGEFQA